MTTSVWTNWSFEEKTFVKQSMISEWEKCAQKLRFALTMLCCGGEGVECSVLNMNTIEWEQSVVNMNAIEWEQSVVNMNAIEWEQSVVNMNAIEWEQSVVNMNAIVRAKHSIHV